MSKELTPLQAYKEFLDIIEIPVKSHLLNSNDKPTLERYRVLRTQIEEELQVCEMERTLRVRLENITYELVKEKQDKENKILVFDIIKYKNVDIQTLKRTNNVLEYNSCVAKALGEKELTQEEYDLSKRALL